MNVSMQQPVRFGSIWPFSRKPKSTPQKNNPMIQQVDTALKAVYPQLADTTREKLAAFAATATPMGQKALVDELELLGKMPHQNRFSNPEFARRELIALIIDVQYPETHTPDDRINDAITVSRRRNGERPNDDLGMRLLVGQARQQVTAMQVAEALRTKGQSPEMIADVAKRIAEDTSYVGEALRPRPKD